MSWIRNTALDTILDLMTITEQEVPAYIHAGHGAGVLPSSRHLQHGHCCQTSTQVQ